MLRPEERRQRDVRILMQPVGGVRQAAVDRGRVADQADAAAGNQRPIDGEQAIDAGCDDLAADDRGNRHNGDCSARHRIAARHETEGGPRFKLPPGARAAGKRPRQEAGAERIGEHIAPEAVERFAVVPDEDDVALLLHDVGDGVPGECQRRAPPAKIARAPVKMSRPLGCAASSGIEDGALK